MSRKMCKLALVVLALSFILVPGVHAGSPLEIVSVVPDLETEGMVAGNTYVVVITFNNVAEESVSLTVEMSVTSRPPIVGLDEIFVDYIKLNGLDLDPNQGSPGVFKTEKGTVLAESTENKLIINLRTAINLMPGTYEFEIGLLGEEIEPEPEPEPGPLPSPGRANEKPVADAGPDQAVYVDEVLIFDGSGSYDPDGPIMSWGWSFGDKEEASGETVSHTYSEPGVYTVTLTVQDYRHAKVSDTCIVTVTEEAEPEPIIVPPLPPILSDLTITPDEIELGEDVTISFVIKNMDTQPITYIVNLNIEGELIPIVFMLEGGESETLEFESSPETVGTYQVAVDGLTGSFTVNPVPIVLEPAEFIISGFTVSPTEVPTGDAVTVSVTITNIGELTGTHTLEIEIDGETPEGPPIETVLEGGASKTITVTVTEEEPREHTVKVDGLTEIFTVTAPPGFVWTPAYISGILILIIIAGTTTYTLYRRDRLSPPKSPPGSENPGD